MWYSQVRYPALDWPPFMDYFWQVMSIVCLWATFHEYRQSLDPRGVDDVSAKPTICKVAGGELILFGLVFLGGAISVTWEAAHRPTAHAVVVDKEVRRGGFLLTLEFDIAGRKYEARAGRRFPDLLENEVKGIYGSRKGYEISYDPRDP